MSLASLLVLSIGAFYNPDSDLNTRITNLNDDFNGELKSKQDALDATQAQLRTATRELAEQRRQIQAWQGYCNELDQVHQRLRNISKALKDEDEFDWTGRSEPDGQPSTGENGLAFLHRGPGSTMQALGSGQVIEVPQNVGVDPAVPTPDTARDFVRLRRLKMWYERIDSLMSKRLEVLRGMNADKEFMCKKVVSLCTGVPIDEVEGVRHIACSMNISDVPKFQMLENLLIAVESEAQVVDLGRVAGFMQKVCSLLIYSTIQLNHILNAGSGRRCMKFLDSIPPNLYV